MFLFLGGILFVPDVYSQNPSYQMLLMNDEKISNTEYQFDIYLLRTGTTSFKLGGCQMSFAYNSAILNGGTLTVSWVPSSSQLNLGQINTTFNTETEGVIKIAAVLSVGDELCSDISPLFPGTRVGRLKLVNSVLFPAFPADFNYCFTVTPYPTVIAAYVSNLITEITDSSKHFNYLTNPILGIPGILTLTSLIQGFYNDITMVPDTVTVELHNSSSPYALIDSKKEILNASGTGTFSFNNAVNVSPYYIVIKHRNGLETWSSSEKSFVSSLLSYDFTTDSSKAYGNNMVQKGTKWCIYSGDVNQDEFIDGSDVSDCYNDASIGQSGYVITDVTCDDFVDGTDVSIIYNNASAGIGAAYPSKKKQPTKKLELNELEIKAE